MRISAAAFSSSGRAQWRRQVRWISDPHRLPPRMSCFFIYGFAKNDMANITAKELETLKGYSTLLLSYSDQELDMAVSGGELFEVRNNAEQIAED